MKKIFLVLSILFLFCLFLPKLSDAGGGDSFNISIVNISPSPAQTGEIVRVQIHTWDYLCDAFVPNSTTVHYETINASGCASYSPATSVVQSKAPKGRVQLTVSGGGNNILTSPPAIGADGNATFEFTTTEAGQKTIGFSQYDGTFVMAGNWDSRSFTVSAPQASSVTVSNGKVASPNVSSVQSGEGSQTNTTQPNTAATTTPAVPLTVIVGNTLITGLSSGEKPVITEEKRIFSGKTLPNGLVHLFFHSVPFEDFATADASGNWTYELTKDLGQGEHQLQVTVTDPVSKLTSVKSNTISFVVATNPQKTPSKVKSGNLELPALLTLVMLSIVAVGLVIARHYHLARLVSNGLKE